MFDVGRVCIKTAGREAGKYCVIVKKMDENFVMVTGPRELTSVKRRRCNINHLEPLMDVLKVKSDAPDNEVLKAYQEANLSKRLGLEAARAKPEHRVKEPEKKPETRAPERKAEPKAKPKVVKKAEKPKPAKKAVKAKPAKKSPAKKPAPKKAKAKPAKKAAGKKK